MTMLHYLGHVYFSSEAEKLEAKTLKEIRQSCKTIGKSSLEITAYLCALGESKGLNVEKHRKQVQRELQKDSDEEGTFANIPFMISGHL